MDQSDDEARLFWGDIVKTKHQSLTSITFMQLSQVPTSSAPYLHSVYFIL